MTQIPISSDLDVFFTDGELAQDVDVSGVIITAIITDFYEIIPIGEAGIEGSDIQMIAQSLDIPGLQHGDPVSVGIEQYTVAEIKPSNAGITRVRLVNV